MKKIIGLLSLCLVLFLGANASKLRVNREIGKNELKKSEKKDKQKLNLYNKKKKLYAWTQTSKCGVTYTVYWYCLSCLEADYWSTYFSVQYDIDFKCNGFGNVITI